MDLLVCKYNLFCTIINTFIIEITKKISNKIYGKVLNLNKDNIIICLAK